MNSITDIRKKWLNQLSLSGHFNLRDIELLERASFVFENNLFDTDNAAWGAHRGILPSPGKYNGVWNWDSAFHALAVSCFDPKLAYEQFEIFFDFQGEDGIFPDVIYADGTVKDNYSKPPVLPWAFIEVYEKCPYPDLLSRAYNCFCKNLDFWNHFRRDENYGLYYYDCRRIDGNWQTHQKWESGMDNSPRWDKGVSQWLAVDLNGFMVMFFDSLRRMAALLKLKKDAAFWQKESDALRKKINESLWCPDKNCFTDRDRFTGAFSDVLSSASYVALFSGCADTEKSAQMNDNACNTALFFPSMPTVAINSGAFSPSDYWRGPVWLNFVYFACEGLRKYGYSATAERIKEYTLNVCANEKRSIFEYYNALTGEGLGAESFGWSAAFIIELILDRK